MQLKLAEYNLETGKFERFLKFDNFFLSQNWVIVDSKSEFPDLEFAWGFAGNLFKKDQKDPLNRFNGLFDGRTYGNGKFVLIRGVEHEGKVLFEDDCVVVKNRYEETETLCKVNIEQESCYCCFIVKGINIFLFNDELKGNLHENPELFEKIEEYPL